MDTSRVEEQRAIERHVEAWAVEKDLRNRGLTLETALNAAAESDGGRLLLPHTPDGTERTK